MGAIATPVLERDQGSVSESHGERPSLGDILLLVLLFLFVIWTIKVWESLSGQSLAQWGMRPREVRGLLGLVTMPLLHKDFAHLVSNSVALLTLGVTLLYFYPRVAFRVVVGVWLLGGLLVWLLARPSIHIGASGIVYGLASFLFFGGVIRRNRASVGPALIVAMLYGGAVWGILPIERGISWEGHLFGAVTGLGFAILYRNVDRPLPEEWPEEGAAVREESGELCEEEDALWEKRRDSGK